MKESIQNFTHIATVVILAVVAYHLLGTKATPPDHAACRQAVAKIELENVTLMATVMKLQIETKAFRRDFMIHLQTVKGMEFMPQPHDFVDMGSAEDEGGPEPPKKGKR